MKKLQNKICIALSVLLSLSALVGCGAKKENAYTGNTDKDIVNHYVEGTLHKRTVTSSNNKFIEKTENGATCEYKIVYDGENEFTMNASGFFKTNVESATGTKIAVETYSGQTWTKDSKYVVFGVDELFRSAGLSMPNEDLGMAGFYIKTVGKSVFVSCPKKDGYQMGAIALSEILFGYDMVGDGFYVYEKDGEYLPNIEVIERPDFDYRATNERISNTGVYGMGFTPGTSNHEIVMTVRGNSWHNSYSFLEPKVYYDQKEHWKWYTKEVSNQTDKNEYHIGQLCYTAHGDDAEYREMLETSCEVLKETVLAYPELDAVTFTEQDNSDWCDCDACKAMMASHNGCEASTCITFLNDLSDMIDPWLKENGRDLTIYFLAYLRTVEAPVTKNADGTFSFSSDMVLHEHVGVAYAPIAANYYKTLYDDENTTYASILTNWSKIADRVLVWFYETNFLHYFYPFESWAMIPESYRYCKENNVIYIYAQGQSNINESTAFSKLKEYIDIKYAIDVNTPYQDTLKKFFKYYYGEGGEYMRQFFDELQTHLSYMYETNPTHVRGYIYETVEDASVWSMSQMERWISLCEKAYEANESYKYTNQVKYNEVYDHVCLESIFPRYALCTMFANEYSAKYGQDALYELRVAFKKDAEHFKFDRTYESKPDILDLYASWGLN